MWDKYFAIILALSTGINAAACTKKESAGTRVEINELQNSELERLSQEFQEAHNITGIEGLEARARAYRNFGNYYTEQERYDDAKKSYEQSMKIGGESADAYAGLAKLEYLRGNKAYAKQLCRKALKIDGEHETARELLERK